MPRMLYAVVIGTAAVLMACADPGGTDPKDPGATSTSGSASASPTGSSPPVSSTGSPPGSPTGSPPPVSSTGSPPEPTSGSGEITLRGSMQDGVEPGCLLLDAQDGRKYLLLGGDRNALQSHSEVVVRGRPQPNLATTCQQGIPFTVVDVKPA
jgi:hypothetical protein